MTEQEKEKHIKEIIKILEVEKIFTFKDIFVFYKGCSRSTAYANELDKSDELKEALDMNKRRGVQSLIDKWIDSENATLQIAAFKIIAEPEERKAISQNYTDITSKDEKINNIDPFSQIRQNAGVNEKADTSD
jgi:hypothetical protein